MYKPAIFSYLYSHCNWSGANGQDCPFCGNLKDSAETHNRGIRENLARCARWYAACEQFRLPKSEEDVAENCTSFEKIHYNNLKARQKELFNFQKIAATLADYGFNCIKLADDWQGADFLAYHINGTTTLKVQLKSRLTIDQKYCGKDIWMAFPHRGYWYLIKHDHLLEKVGDETDWLNSLSWKNGRVYSSTSINAGLLGSLAEHRLGPVYSLGDVGGIVAH